MKSEYQIIFIGHNNQFIDDIKASINSHIRELGIDTDFVKYIDENNFDKEYKANSPIFCIYFGDSTNPRKNVGILQSIINDSNIVLPVVEDLNYIAQAVPSIIRSINGFQLAAKENIEPLVATILEGLGLLRLARRLFISYRRDESTLVAIQLFEQLEKNGFDVFLDTHSIRPGDQFQDELWHRMADTDVVVLLNTKDFLTSKWTEEELAKANSMAIGILQLIWPDHKIERGAKLSIPIQLKDTDFGNSEYTDSKSYLEKETISRIVAQVESLRARSLASRQDNIITEFMSSARKLGLSVYLQNHKFITINSSNGDDWIAIPTIGVPQAFTYHQSEDLVKHIKSSNTKGVFLIYDHRSIRDKWLKHLDWLDAYLPLKTKKIVDVETWLGTL